MANDLAKKLYGIANVQVKPADLRQCHDFMQNDTVINCPLGQDKNSKEFLVVIYNQNTQKRDHLARILLPSSNYKAFLLDSQSQKFKELEADIFENKHFTKTGDNFDDSVMYFKLGEIDVDQIVVVKLVKTETSQASFMPVNEKNATNTKEKSLTLLGVTEQGYIAFNYTNNAEDI